MAGNSEEIKLFHWADYLTLCLSLLMSVTVGIYYGFFHKKQVTTQEYLLANKSMHAVPVSISLFLSWFSAIAFLAEPVEVYYYGAIYWYIGVGYMIGLIPVALYFAPLFQKLNLISCYEFIEKRYNRPFRITLFLLNVITGFPFLGLALYAPCLALYQVTNINLEVLIVVMGAIVIFYSSLGGIKAVVWTDTLQMVVLTVGYIAMLIGGLVTVGGFATVWNKAQEGGRLNFVNFDPNPLERSTFWTYLIGGFTRTFCPLISSAVFIQRYNTVKTPNQARAVVMLNIPVFAITVTILFLTGLVVFAYFGDCDPLYSGKISRGDQIVPLMVMETLGAAKGVPGLFMAGVVGATLSTLSSAMNTIAALILKDLIEILYEHKAKKPMNDTFATMITKVLTVVMGMLIVTMALVVKLIKRSLFTLTVTLVSLITGPQAGVFFVAVLMPWVDWKSCILGFVVGTGVPAWLSLGAFLKDITHPTLPVYLHGCSLNFTGSTNSTSWADNSNSTGPAIPDETFSVDRLYDFSPLLINVLAFILVVMVSGIGGAIHGCVSRKKESYGLDNTIHLENKENHFPLERHQKTINREAEVDGKVD